MCGIGGLVDIGGLDPAATEGRIGAAIARLGFRGPDARGSWTDWHCALVHTRLAIIDLSPLGAQPMQRDGLVITYNGELFNYVELRNELAELGHRFRSNSDTEVILAGWQEWGEHLLCRMVGMFAFAIWDVRARTLFAARDRFGEKPFLYAASGRRLAFGSDVIACEAMLGEARPLDATALQALFTLRFIPEPASIAVGIRKLPAGHWLRFDENGLAVASWYNLARERPSQLPDDVAADTELRQRFDAAVAARLVADVPVGVFLSSGLNSSLVAASVAASGAKLKTFTVGFANQASYYEERPLAAALARHLGAEHTEITVSANCAGDVLDRVFIALDEPFGDFRQFRPTWYPKRRGRKSASC